MDGSAFVTPFEWVDATSDLILLAVGAFLATRRPHTRLTMAFTAFALLAGASDALSSLRDLGALSIGAWQPLVDLASDASEVALVTVAWLYARPKPIEGIVIVGGTTLGLLGILFAWAGAPASPLGYVDLPFGVPAGLAAGILVASAYRRMPTGARAGCVLVAFALSLSEIVDTAGGLAFLAEYWRGPPSPMVTWEPFVSLRACLVLLMAVLWLRHAARTSGADARRASWASLATLGILLIVMALGVLVGPELMFNASDGLGLYGTARTTSVVLLGAAVLRDQIDGINARLRWAVSRTTLGAVFVAAFFIASTLAQSYLQASLGPVIGIVAAGALVFAFAPLQRAADRLANAAIPPDTRSPDASAGRSRAFRAAVRAALADGAVTRDEEAHLAEVAQELGIGAADALRLRREVESEPATSSDNP